MGECADCGGVVENKNAAGHYRDKCRECIRAVADAIPSHVETCDRPECVVCQDYREEARGR